VPSIRSSLSPSRLAPACSQAPVSEAHSGCPSGLRHHKSRAGSDFRAGRNGRSSDAGREDDTLSPGDGGSVSWASRPPREEGGIVTEAIAQTERADSAKHQAIMPWLFQDEESQDSYSRHARTVSRR
jgi:hypothetical protein